MDPQDDQATIASDPIGDAHNGEFALLLPVLSLTGQANKFLLVEVNQNHGEAQGIPSSV